MSYDTKYMECPFCEKEGRDEFTFVHVYGAELLTGKDDHEVSKGIVVDKDVNISMAESGRREGHGNRKRELDVIMRCVCEMGHHVFERRFLFHKGQTEWHDHLISVDDPAVLMS